MTDRKSTWDLHQRRKCNSYNSIRHLITRSADSSLPMSVASRSPNVEASFFVYMCFQLTISLFLLISQNRILLFAITSRDRVDEPQKSWWKWSRDRLRQFYPSVSCESARFFLLIYFSLGFDFSWTREWIREEKCHAARVRNISDHHPRIING